MKAIYSLVIFVFLAGCNQAAESVFPVTGAERTEEYLPLLEGRRVAIAANQTTLAGGVHLVDTLISLGVDVRVIFAPEHGFREMAAAGNHISSGVDEVTGVRITSLYGAKFKPSPEDLKDIDVVIFDIQDVGVRFYTYISTMHYVMEACAENGIACIILDRPNPNGFMVDGPLREPGFETFVGKHPVPVAHGMTIGEYALMVNGEGWLAGGVRADLKVVTCLNYDHSTLYELPVPPSPNLPNQNSVYLYPSICFFEGTQVSLGRGTDFPFQVFGAPEFEGTYSFTFTPVSRPEAGNPPHRDVTCYGVDLRDATLKGLVPTGKLDMSWVIEAWNAYPDKSGFFRGYFDTLAGTTKLREQIEAGMSAEEIRATWEEGLEGFRKIRERYLLYP